MEENGKVHRGSRRAVEELAEFFEIVIEPTRMELLACIAASPIYVKELAARTTLERSLLSHHLRQMRVVGLVVYTRAGRHHRYTTGTAITAVALSSERVRVTLVDPQGGEHVFSLPRQPEGGGSREGSVAEVKPPGLLAKKGRRKGA